MERHWQETYPLNLKRAYFITIGLTLVVTVLFLGIGYLKSMNLLATSSRADTKTRVIAFTYAQLGPPPSLLSEEGTSIGSGGVAPQTSTAGVPKPVADTEAVAETTPTQAELGSGGTGTGGLIMGEEIPASAVYLPYLRVEVKPEPKYIPMPELPKKMVRADLREATVITNALVDFDGRVRTVEILESSGNPALDTVACQAALQSLFTPARHRGQSVRVWVSIPFRFMPPERQ